MKLKLPIRPALAAMLATALLPVGVALAQPPPAQPASPAAPLTQALPLFDCFHINFAWGFTLSGKYIDADGTIYSYRKQKPAWLPKAIVEDGKRFLTQADLDAKYVERTKIGSLVASELDAHRGAIEAAAAGKLVQAGPGANDAGTSSCHAYIHDASRGRFRDVDLGSDGGISDSPQRNDAKEAQELMTWLKSVGVAR